MRRCLLVLSWLALASCLPADGCHDAPADGSSVRERAQGDRIRKPRVGKWRPVEDIPGLSDDQRELVAQLQAIGYADGTQAVEAARTVTVHDRTRAYPGLNLYNAGHAAEAFLIDMDARVLHRWSARFADVFPDADVRPGAPGANHWRRVVLGSGGELYGIWEGRGLVKLDAHSRVLWSRLNQAHHHLALLDGGREVAVLVREVGVDPRLHAERPVMGDFVEILDGTTGALLRRISLVDALLESPYADVLTTRRRTFGDVLHTNSLYVLDGAVSAVAPAFVRGDLLLTMRNSSALGVLDLDTERFTWVHRGDYVRPHDARITPSGRLLLFDNRGGPGRTSRVLAFDPATMAVTWTWAGVDPREPLRSPTLGTAQELPNGNVLVTESERGHAVEITETGEVVWEFWNPHRAGAGGEFIAALFEVLRVPPDTGRSWIPAQP